LYQTLVKSMNKNREKLADGIDVYLINDLEDIAIRISPKQDRYFAKQKGGREYVVEGTTDLVTTAFISWIELTEKEYLNY
jgi:hypothetical protein